MGPSSITNIFIDKDACKDTYKVFGEILIDYEYTKVKYAHMS